MDVVWQFPNGARLFQGGTRDVERIRSTGPGSIRAVALMAEGYQPRLEQVHVFRAQLRDDPCMVGPEREATLVLARHVAERLAEQLQKGRDCLSSCQAGLNRSGLASALTVMRLLPGVPPEAVIRAIRRARGPDAMSNWEFVRMVEQEADARLSA